MATIFKSVSHAIHFSFARLVVFQILINGFSSIAHPQDVRPFAPENVQLLPKAATIWSLADLQRLAEENNPTIRQAAASVDMSRGLYRQAGLYPNPQLGYLQNNSVKDGQNRSNGVFYGQEIVTRQKLRKAQETEIWEIEQGNWNYQAQLKRVSNDVELRYWDVLGAQHLAALSDNLEQISVGTLKTTELLFGVREVTKMDLLQARIQLRTSQLVRREAQARLSASLKQLAAVIGCQELPFEVSGTLAGDIPQLDWESCWQDLRARSHQIQAAKARAQHFQNQLRLERANTIPNANLQVVAERDHVNQLSTVSTLVSMPVPIFNRNQGNIDRAAAATHESSQEIYRTELALRDQLAEVYRRYESSKAQVEELKSGILPAAKENMGLAVIAYKAAEVGYLTVLSAQKTYVETNQAYLEAWIELHKSNAEIKGLLLTGALNPAEVGTALQSASGGQRRGVLNQIQESGRSNALPAALQTGGGQ